MPRWGMVIDLDKCTACQACVLACMVENNVPPSDPEKAAQGRSIRWLEMAPFAEGKFPDARLRLLPRPCMHCDNPPCIKVCPVAATYKSPEGIVGQIYPRCIGCRYCTAACPYTVRYFNWTEPEWPEPLGRCLNKDVSVRPKGVVEKCSFCHHRLIRAREQAKADGREFHESDYVPACVQACPAEAMYFGDLDNPRSEVTRLARSTRAFRLLEDLGTRPKVFYLREGE